MDKVKLSYYCNGRTGKPFNNAVAVVVGNLTIWFSYETPIAFQYSYMTLEGKKFDQYISENIWGQTTGKHLNAINSDKSVRLKRYEFKEKLNEYVMRNINRG